MVPRTGLALTLTPTSSFEFQGSAPGPPQSRPISLRKANPTINGQHMADRTQILTQVLEHIEPFNKKGIAVTESTRFAQDLEWDSLTVLDFVANIEDEFDILIPMNLQAEIENVGQLADSIEKLQR